MPSLQDWIHRLEEGAWAGYLENGRFLCPDACS
jgi:hypothetical protein